MPFRERRLILGLMAALALATPMFAQDRDMTPDVPYAGTLQVRVSTLQGNITNEAGHPLPAITVEVTRVVQEPQFSAAPRQSWRVRTDENGDFKIQVPSPGVYVVSASQVDVGTDAIRVIVEIDRPATANLRLWNPLPVSTDPCGASDTAFREAALPADEHPALVHLMRWLQAVEQHIPGCNDSFAREANALSLEELQTLVGDLMNLQTAALIWNGSVQAPQFLRDSMGERDARAFLQKAKANLPNAVEVTSHIALRSSTESVRGRIRESRARIGADRIQLYNRWFTRVEIAGVFRGNDTVLRGAMLHTDLAVFGDADPDQRGSRFHLVEDGGRRGGGYATVHWRIGRLLLDTITSTPRDHISALLWYRTVSAYLLSEGNLSEARAHLDRARHLFPDRLFALLDSAYLHERLSSPAVQAAIVELRAAGTDDVAVESRREELENTARFLRQALALAPDEVNARVRLGRTLSELDRHHDAMAELHRALEAELDQEHHYLAQLFLGRAAQALGNRDEAKRRYEEAAALYPTAQSPRLALAQLARTSNDRAGALRELDEVTKQAVDLQPIDPWWSYYRPHMMAAADLMSRIRTFETREAQ